MFYTYVLQSEKNGNFYTGYTSDLRKRFKEHNEGKFGYTKGIGLYHLVYYFLPEYYGQKPVDFYYEACIDEGDARSRALYLKTGKGKRYLKYRLKRFLFRTG